MNRKSVLILGGTAEASALARAIPPRFGDAWFVTTSLAGRTASPGPVVGCVRRGGFGGSAGLLRYLAENRVDCVIDATHPFAARISAAARVACERARVPRLLLLRSSWRRDPRDRWIEVDDMASAALLVGRLSRRAFLTVGAKEAAAFAPARHVHFLLRLIEPPRQPLPFASCEIVLGRGPFTLAGERRLIERYRLDLLVSKASGGSATEAKILAAREEGLPVVMIRRPPPEPGPTVETIEEALLWLEDPLTAVEERSMR